MNEETILRPDYIFEVSWEVCNKIGGIHTVLSTKALTLVNEWEDKLIMIGPDVWKGNGAHPEFTEDKNLFPSLRPDAEQRGLKIKIGRWNIAGNPIAILVDFTSYFAEKDEIFKELWLRYQLDSLTGHWDYIEPALFGYAAGKVLECFYDHYITYSDKIVAQFHEWMTGTALLYVNQHVPQIGTIFTTHATVVGRTLSGNGLPLYSKFDSYNADQIAREYNVASKHSLEKITARTADCFTTVSAITAKECEKFLLKIPDVITPNGYDESFVPDPFLFKQRRISARKSLLSVAGAVLGRTVSDDALLVLHSGRYEFRTKGIDLFIDAIGLLNGERDQKRDIIAFIFVPAHQTGPRRELLLPPERRNGGNGAAQRFLTHNLQGSDTDAVLQRIQQDGLANRPEDHVNIIFAPVYLDGNDGLFNLTYADILIGFDLGIFPSYYEPWGYTPTETLAFHIPTVTTNFAGLGMLIKQSGSGFNVLDRSDHDERHIAGEIATIIRNYAVMTAEQMHEAREAAFRLSKLVQWKNLIVHYKAAYSIALQKTLGRESLFVHEGTVTQWDVRGVDHDNIRIEKPEWRKIFIQFALPENLLPLKKLSMNLWWTWNEEAEDLFQSMDPALWESSGHNPIELLERLSYAQIQELERNDSFIDRLSSVHRNFELYMSASTATAEPMVAYFCMEYGLHASLKIYSGGLGILAGDYMKEASDSGANIVGLGLLYRKGYFKQRLSLRGDQIAEDDLQKFSYLPLEPVRNEDGDWVKITIAFPGRTLYAKAWRVAVGRTSLYLLDTDIPENGTEDRQITGQLYGGDLDMRLKQEFLLGIGGVRMLNMLGFKPDVYHCNEGHAAFVGIERIHRLIMDENISYDQAVEIIRGSSLFTTHTPVEAGHDAFTEDMLRIYFSHFPEALNISWKRFVGLGRANPNDSMERFSMSILAARLSQEMNGVSMIHRTVSRKLFSKLWEGYAEEELHIGSVTNGVHLSTWMAKEWKELYRSELRADPVSKQADPAYWNSVHAIANRKLWRVHIGLKQRLLASIRETLDRDVLARQVNPPAIESYPHMLDENTLLIGFARRMVGYKRSDMIFRNLPALSQIVNDPNRPVIFLFAGKPHPNDPEGQQRIKEIFSMARKPEFAGKILYLENYSMEIARQLVQGVDVWLNTPVMGMEASGTSGMKANLNGVLNFSVMDGWWAEAYQESLGWQIPGSTAQNADYRNEVDAEILYRTLEREIIPLYFDRDRDDIPVHWIEKMKSAIAAVTPAFTARRMLDEYEKNYYLPLQARHKSLTANRFEKAKCMAAWKERIANAWDRVRVVSVNVYDSANKALPLGENLQAEISLDLNGIAISDVGVELLILHQRPTEAERAQFLARQELLPGEPKQGVTVFSCSLPMTQSGVYEYGFRIYPKNAALVHRQDFPIVQWV